MGNLTVEDNLIIVNIYLNYGLSFYIFEGEKRVYNVNQFPCEFERTKIYSVLS